MTQTLPGPGSACRQLSPRLARSGASDSVVGEPSTQRPKSPVSTINSLTRPCQEDNDVSAPPSSRVLNSTLPVSTAAVRRWAPVVPVPCSRSDDSSRVSPSSTSSTFRSRSSGSAVSSPADSVARSAPIRKLSRRSLLLLSAAFTRGFAVLPVTEPLAESSPAAPSTKPAGLLASTCQSRARASAAIVPEACSVLPRLSRFAQVSSMISP